MRQRRVITASAKTTNASPLQNAEGFEVSGGKSSSAVISTVSFSFSISSFVFIKISVLPPCTGTNINKFFSYPHGKNDKIFLSACVFKEFIFKIAYRQFNTSKFF